MALLCEPMGCRSIASIASIILFLMYIYIDGSPSRLCNRQTNSTKSHLQFSAVNLPCRMRKSMRTSEQLALNLPSLIKVNT